MLMVSDVKRIGLIVLGYIVAPLRLVFVLNTVRQLYLWSINEKCRSRILEIFDPTFPRHPSKRGHGKRYEIVTCLWGETLKLDIDEHIGYTIFMRSFFDLVPIAVGMLMMQSLRSGDKHDKVYLDVGANIGSSSIGVALRGFPVVAVEASPRTAARLSENVALNSPLPYTILNVGVTSKEMAAKDKFLTLHTIQGNPGASSLVPGWAGRAVASDEITRLLTIDDIARMLGDIDIAYIKVDVEGYEMNALAGARETLIRFRPVVLFEWRPDAMDHDRPSGQAITALFPNDYTFFSVGAAIENDRSIRLFLRSFDPNASAENIIAIPSGLDPASRMGALRESGTALVLVAEPSS